MKKPFRLFLIGFSVFCGSFMLLPVAGLVCELYYFGSEALASELNANSIFRGVGFIGSVAFLSFVGLMSVGYSFYVVATGEEWN